MSAPVDVLAVLSRRANELTRKYGPDNDLAAARAAVAELVGQLQAIFDAESDGFKVRLAYFNRAGVTVYPKGRDDRVQELRAALARVRGEA